MTAKIISLPFAARDAERTSDAKPMQNETEHSVVNELRRARIRIAQLEASLTEAMQDSLANFNRARDAERSLMEYEDRSA